MAQLAGKVSDETLERWQQFKQGHQGESFNDLIGMILDAADEKSLAAGHPTYAATLSACDDLQGKLRDLLAGLVVAADEAVEKARADAERRSAAAEAMADAAREEAEAAKAEARQATDLLEAQREELAKAQAERDEVLAKAALVDDARARAERATDEASGLRSRLEAADELAAKAKDEADARVAELVAQLEEARSEASANETRAILAEQKLEVELMRVDEATKARDQDQATIKTLIAQVTRSQADADRLRAERDTARGEAQEAKERADGLEAELASSAKAKPARADRGDGQLPLPE